MKATYWQLIIACMTIGLTLSGCVGHKAIRICLPDADSEIEFEGPSSISGVSTGKIELKGRGSYLMHPKQQLMVSTAWDCVYGKHDNSSMDVYLDGLDDCPFMATKPLPKT